eukprot:COSAG02_NODE_7745_length_2864_cov_3.574684_1_plen_105_part_10
MGIYRKPIGCRFVLERKYKGDVYERHKAHMVCQGHRGYLMPGRDFEDTYAPTPNHASTRLMQALSLMPHPVNKAKWFSGCASARMRSGYARTTGVNELNTKRTEA